MRDKSGFSTLPLPLESQYLARSAIFARLEWGQNPMELRPVYHLSPHVHTVLRLPVGLSRLTALSPAKMHSSSRSSAVL
jgi:hypothetical protein